MPRDGVCAGHRVHPNRSTQCNNISAQGEPRRSSHTNNPASTTERTSAGLVFRSWYITIAPLRGLPKRLCLALSPSPTPYKNHSKLVMLGLLRAGVDWARKQDEGAVLDMYIDAGMWVNPYAAAATWVASAFTSGCLGTSTLTTKRGDQVK